MMPPCGGPYFSQVRDGIASTSVHIPSHWMDLMEQEPIQGFQGQG